MVFILDVNLPDKIKDGSYVINLDKYSDIGTHWIALYALNNNVTFFDFVTLILLFCYLVLV